MTRLGMTRRNRGTATERMHTVKKNTGLTHSIVVDYSAARARAIRWLGDRYLLAKPINASRDSRPKLAAADGTPAARSS